jgi:TIR domain-containing protein
MSKSSIFLSYSSRDAKLAHQVEGELERLGLKAFNPMRDIPPDADFRKTIQAEMRRSAALVLLVASPYSAASSWMGYEAGMAEALGKRVLLLLPSKYPVAELPEDVATVQVVEFDPKVPKRAAHEIAERLALV